MGKKKDIDLEIPSSGKTFPDECHFEIEMSGVEEPIVAEAIIDEARKQGISVSRLIAAVNGTKHWSDDALIELAEIAAKHKIEVIVCPGHLARGLIEDPSNVFSMMNYQNTKEMDAYFNEVHRCVNIGFRGFLVWRKSMLTCLCDFRDADMLPKETIFKISTFDNNANALDCLFAESLGADSINVTNGLSIESLAEIRRHLKSSTVTDIHMTYWSLYFEKNQAGEIILKTKPYDRVVDAPEIVRVFSPCCLKFEADHPVQSGIGVYDLSDPDKWSVEDLCDHKRNDVRLAAKIVRDIKAKYPEFKCSDWGAQHLRVPVPRK